MSISQEIDGVKTTELEEYHRSFERLSVRTSATVWDIFHGELRQIRCWTDDMSPAGAKIVTDRPIGEEPEFWLQVMLPELQDRIFNCEIVRRGKSVIKTLANLEDIERHTYGIRIVGVADAEVTEALLANRA